MLVDFFARQKYMLCITTHEYSCNTIFNFFAIITLVLDARLLQPETTAKQTSLLNYWNLE